MDHHWLIKRAHRPIRKQNAQIAITALKEYTQLLGAFSTSTIDLFLSVLKQLENVSQLAI